MTLLDRVAPDADQRRQLPLWALAAGTGALIVLALLALLSYGGSSLPARNGPPIEQLAVERTVLRPGVIVLTVRNTGPDPVRVPQVFVNDSFVDVTGGADPIGRLRSATLTLRYPWQDGQPYLVSMLTSTGVVIEHEIAAAVATPQGGSSRLMALLGFYVGIVPILLGMLVLPVLKRAGPQVVPVLLAVTVGLLAFLAVEAGLEAITLGEGSGAAFGGPVLGFLGAGLAFLALTALDGALRRGRSREGAGASGLTLATTIAVGIGLHNLGEGLAIGSSYAVGELALGAFLVAGFALHNTTEGLAIVAPLTAQRTSLVRLAGLALIAGGPAMVGAVVGARVDNDEVSALLLGLGVGAIVQVIVQVAPRLRSPGQRLSPGVVAGLAVGVLLMYVTGLAVSG